VDRPLAGSKLALHHSSGATTLGTTTCQVADNAKTRLGKPSPGSELGLRNETRVLNERLTTWTVHRLGIRCAAPRLTTGLLTGQGELCKSTRATLRNQCTGSFTLCWHVLHAPPRISTTWSEMAGRRAAPNPPSVFFLSCANDLTNSTTCVLENLRVVAPAETESHARARSGLVEAHGDQDARRSRRS
jgi:hypothetical protein